MLFKHPYKGAIRYNLENLNRVRRLGWGPGLPPWAVRVFPGVLNFGIRLSCRNARAWPCLGPFYPGPGRKEHPAQSPATQAAVRNFLTQRGTSSKNLYHILPCPGGRSVCLRSQCLGRVGLVAVLLGPMLDRRSCSDKPNSRTLPRYSGRFS